MLLEIPYGPKSFPISVDETRCDLIVARSKNPPATSTWEDVVSEALAHPIGAPPVAQQGLRGKKVAIVTDDWARPTPAYRVIPRILLQLAQTGVTDSDITFVTASGMHDPMSREDLARKLGRDVVNRYRCVSHDGGDWEMLAFVGVSSMGTPVWVNRYVADADYRIGLGRVFLHVTHGYEGGYKLILPGVSGFDTILRDHSFNFSEDAVPGTHENPSRAETDNVGRMVGFDFLINVVVNDRSEPIKAFAGAVEPVHQRGIEYGDREVWGADVADLADVTVASHGAGSVPELGFDAETMRRACAVTRPDGVVIAPTDRFVPPLPDWRDGELADDGLLNRLARKEFGPALQSLAFSELMRLHERRDWPLSRREIQWRVKAIRGEFYRRRWLMAANERDVLFTRHVQKALDDALARPVLSRAKERGGRPRLLILPDGSGTLPKVRLHRATA